MEEFVIKLLLTKQTELDNECFVVSQHIEHALTPGMTRMKMYYMCHVCLILILIALLFCLPNNTQNTYVCTWYDMIHTSYGYKAGTLHDKSPYCCTDTRESPFGFYCPTAVPGI